VSEGDPENWAAVARISATVSAGLDWHKREHAVCWHAAFLTAAAPWTW
jgi:hypothetical protein